jgi:hypothetical protein
MCGRRGCGVHQSLLSNYNNEPPNRSLAQGFPAPWNKTLELIKEEEKTLFCPCFLCCPILVIGCRDPG